MRRRIVVLANTQGRDVGAVVTDLQQRLSTLVLPAGYHLSYEGQFCSQQEATRLISLLAIFSLAGIFPVCDLRKWN